MPRTPKARAWGWPSFAKRLNECRAKRAWTLGRAKAVVSGCNSLWRRRKLNRSRTMTKVLLYVDDSEDDLLLFRAACTLARARFQLVLLHGGPQAILYLDRRDPYADRDQFPDPDIALLDVKMPGMDGFGVLQHLRSDARRAAWPVGLFTSSDWPGDVERARKLGATWYFHKPPDIGQMIEFITILEGCMHCSPEAHAAAERLSKFRAGQGDEQS